VIYRGGCHCGAVQFEVEAPERIECQECNCSICAKSGYLHLIVPKSRFRLVAGDGNLTTYTFNTGVAQHKFCRTCGIKSFYIPRSNPDGIDVNVRCLEPPPRELIVRPFDGRNWEQHAGELAHLSREG
jgi:hypothetical protein